MTSDRAASRLNDDLVLPGERILLRPVVEDDAAAVFHYANDPEVTRYLPWEPATDMATVRAFLAEQVTRRHRGESLALAIVLRETEAVIGSIDLMDLRRTGLAAWLRPRQAEIGYLMSRDYWGRGLMTEAARLVVAHGFKSLGLARIFAWADVDNTGSRRVLEKTGMRESGSETRIVKGVTRLYIRYEIERASKGLKV